MARLYKLFIYLIFYSTLLTQNYCQNIGAVFNRIENSIKSGDIYQIEDLFPLVSTIRIEDSLYQKISSIQALQLLNNYFRNKESIEFNFMVGENYLKSGILIFNHTSIKDTLSVDVEIYPNGTEWSIGSFNISNLPTSTWRFP